MQVLVDAANPTAHATICEEANNDNAPRMYMWGGYILGSTFYGTLDEKDVWCCEPSICNTPARFEYNSLSRFIRGDANADTRVNIADAIFVLTYQFSGGKEATCMKSMDANDDEIANIADAIWILNYQFNSGPDPKPTFPECGLDVTPQEEELSCESFIPCAASSQAP